VEISDYFYEILALGKRGVTSTICKIAVLRQMTCITYYPYDCCM